MNPRNSVAVLLICVAVALAAGCSKESPVLGQGGPKAKVTLFMSQVSVERRREDLLFICDAVIDNGTGAQLTVKSNYASAFDGLELIVMDAWGRILARQRCTHHQSLRTLQPRSFPLNEGKNRQKLGFPVSGLPQDRRVYRVGLVGQLPGSSYADDLCSDPVTAVVK